MTLYTDEIIATVRINQAEPFPLTDTLLDTIYTLDPGRLTNYSEDFSIIDWPSWSLALTQNTGISEALKSDYGFALLDTAMVTETTTVNVRYGDVLTQLVRLQEVVSPGYNVVLAQNVAVSEALTAAYALQIAEALGLTDTILPALKYGLTATDTIRLTDAFYNFFSGVLIDNVGVSESLVNKFLAYPALAENVAVSEALTQALVFRVDAAENISLDDIDVLKMIYAGQLAEGVNILAGYVSPSGNFTTWAINTKNFATTEYTNYAFNSFAQIGNQFLGATSTGLYELDGDTDAGAAIIADIKSGLMQLGGSRFTSFKAAYLGMRGSGDFVLKLETGDGKFYNYAVVGRNMQTTRVDLGKGLRARYFSFELISTGQDFDLDSVEFIPLVAQRRV